MPSQDDAVYEAWFGVAAGGGDKVLGKQAVQFFGRSELAKDKLAILISHRFSTVRMADEIVVLHGGRILEQGDHDSLMSAQGHYAHLFSLQAAGYQ